MKPNILLIIFFTTILISGCGPEKSLESRLQEAMDESIKNSGVAGVSAAIIFPDGKMWKGASGISYEDVPATTDMLFDIGSIGKNFQAALCLKLVEEGLLSLNDTLGKWLPHYSNLNGKITIRQILNMTSGIDDFVGDPKSPFRIGYTNIDHEKMWTWEEIYNTYIGKPDFEPGTKCAYSSTNYIVLKQIIEKVTGTKQTTLFENRILKPYHLNYTLADFFNPIPDSMPFIHGWADTNGDGQADDISGYSLNWIASLSPLFVYSTPGDMVQWIDALYNKKTVLGDKMMKEMLTFNRPVQNEPMMKGYGLGTVDINLGAILPNWQDVEIYGHLGSQFGYSTFATYLPELKISVSIMFNRGCDAGTNQAIGMVGSAFFDVLLKHFGVKEADQQNSISDMLEELEKSPNEVHLMYRIAKQQQANNDDYEASLMYEKILKQDPEDNYGYKTEALFWKASYDGVIWKKPENLIAFISEHNDYKYIQDAYRWLAKTYQRRDEMDKAIKVYMDALNKFENDPEFYNHYAWWIYENKLANEYDSAIKYAKSALELKPEACYIWDTLARLYLANGEKQKAIEASTKALNIAPKDQYDEYEKYLNEIKEGKI